MFNTTLFTENLNLISTHGLLSAVSFTKLPGWLFELTSTIDFLFGSRYGFYIKMVLTATVLLSIYIAFHYSLGFILWLRKSRSKSHSNPVKAAKKEKSAIAIEAELAEASTLPQLPLDTTLRNYNDLPPKFLVDNVLKLEQENVRLKNEMEGIYKLWEITSAELTDLRKKHQDLIDRSLVVAPPRSIMRQRATQEHYALPSELDFIDSKTPAHVKSPQAKIQQL